jgi:hypothetical protein
MRSRRVVHRNGRLPAVSGQQHGHPAEAGEPTQACPVPEPVVGARVAGEAFDAALAGFHGISARMLRLAEAASLYATALRTADAAGYAIDHDLTAQAPMAQRPPVGLNPASARTPAVEQWRAFDRAYDALLVAFADRRRTFKTTGDAVNILAGAAEQLAQALADTHAEPSVAIAVCSFCGARADQSRMSFESRHALICDRCIQRSVDALEERYGEGCRK